MAANMIPEDAQLVLRARLRPANGGIMVCIQVYRNGIGWVDVETLPQQFRLALAATLEAWAHEQMK